MIAVLADRQHGVVARRQLLALGIGRRSIDHRVEIGRLHVIHRGVYAVGHTRLSLRGRWMAAVLACGEGALLSHGDAGALWGITAARGTCAHVTVEGRHGRRPGLVTHQVRSLHPDDRAWRDNIPVTALPRTLLDLAGVLDAKRLERAFEDAERQRLLDRRALAQLLERSGGRRGPRALRALLNTHDGVVPDTRSELERLFFDLCRSHDLPLPVCNVLVAGHLVDALWPRERLIVEVDSWEFHRSRRSFEDDRARDAELQLAGYRVIRVTHRRLEHAPEAVAATLRGLLRQRSGSLP